MDGCRTKGGKEKRGVRETRRGSSSVSFSLAFEVAFFRAVLFLLKL